MDIVVRNCNSIETGTISLQAGKLNVKYGPNGIGKSTLAKAIALRLDGDGSKLDQLRPFKYRNNPSPEARPSVDGIEGIQSVAIFGEEYIDQFVFQPDEILKNSFDVFVKTSDYEQKMGEISGLVNDIKEAFSKNEHIEKVIRDLQDLSDSFGRSQTGLSKAGRISKGLSKGNKIEHIPQRLEGYKNLIQSDKSISWIKWQTDGTQFLDVSAGCPFCTAPTERTKTAILAVREEYDAKSVEHLLAVKGTVERLSEYFSADANAKLSGILRNKTGLAKEETNYLLGIKSETDTLREKLVDAKEISFFSLRDAEKVGEKIASLKIDLSLLPRLESQATKVIVDEINKCLDSILSKAGKLEGEVKKQKSGIEKTIKKYRGEINAFLKFAGYRYEVDIRSDGSVYKMKLRHLDSDEDIENGAIHLSYGEKNAFAIVLFMYECLTKKKDLVVLDDPISSFDDNKKFAILEMLFRGKESLQAKTVLMLTHDIEPVIDLVKTLSHTFQPTPVAAFLATTRGNLSEINISKSDIQTFAQICSENVNQLGEPIIKCIYLRRHYELVNDKGEEYNLLSSLFHKRAQPTTSNGIAQRAMTDTEVDHAIAKVREKLPGFDYGAVLARLNDRAAMLALYKATPNRYERIQLFRVMSDAHNVDQVDAVVLKYINESYHVENEYVMQLNPHKYDGVPEYISLECDRLLGIA